MSDAQTLEPLLETQTRQPRKPGRGSQLTKREISLCLQLAEAGKTGREIAQVLGVSDSTISRTLETWGDTRPLARRLLEARATQLAQTVVKTKNADVALRALGKLDVVREDQVSSGNQMVVVLGTGVQQLEPPVLTSALQPQGLSPSLSTPQLRLTVESEAIDVA